MFWRGSAMNDDVAGMDEFRPNPLPWIGMAGAAICATAVGAFIWFSNEPFQDVETPKVAEISTSTQAAPVAPEGETAPASLSIEGDLPVLKIITEPEAAPAAQTTQPVRRIAAVPDSDVRKLPVSDYVLGKSAVTDDMSSAFETVTRARQPSYPVQGGPLPANQVPLHGYLPKGADPSEIRVLDAKIPPGDWDIVTGKATAIHGTRLSLSGVTIELQGVGAPADGDICLNESGVVFDCHAWSREGLMRIMEGNDLECAATKSQRDGARVGWCNIILPTGYKDLSSVLARAGLAYALPTASGVMIYANDEYYSKERGIGLWSGQFTPSRS